MSVWSVTQIIVHWWRCVWPDRPGPSPACWQSVDMFYNWIKSDMDLTAATPSLWDNCIAGMDQYYTCYNWHNTNTKLENCCYKSDSTEKKLIFYIQQGVNKTQNLKSRDWIEKELKSWMMKYKSWLITQVNCNSRWIFVFSFGHTDRLLQLLKLLSQLKSGMFLMWTKDKVLGLHLYFTLQLLAGDN